MKNFQSHIDSKLEFDFNSALIMGTNDEDERLSNGTGKSSILEAIGFCIHNQTKNKNKDDVVRRGAVTACVEMMFSHNDRVFRVVRTHNVKVSKMEVEFEEILPNGEIINKTLDTNTLTNKAIQNTIASNYNVFISSSYFRQGLGFDFAEGTFSSRQELISSLLDLDKWKAYQEEAKRQYKLRSKRLDELKIEINKRGITQEKLESVGTELDSLNKEKAASAIKNAALVAQIKDIENKLSANSGAVKSIRKYRDLEQEIAFVKRKLDTSRNEIASLAAQSSKLDDDLAEFSSAKNSLSLRMAENKEFLSGRDPIDTDAMERQIIEGKAKRSSVSKQVDSLLNDKECLMCGHSWDDLEAKDVEISRRKEYLKKIEKMLEQALSSFATAKDFLNSTQSAELESHRLSSDYAQVSERMEYCYLRKSTVDSNLEGAQEAHSSLVSSLEQLEERLEGLDEISGIDDVEPLESMLTGSRKEFDALREAGGDLVYRLGVLAGEKNILIESIDSYGDLDTELKEANDDVATLGRLTKVFSRDGVPAIIIDNVIEELTRTINEWLHEFCTEPTYIHFVTQKKNNKGDWRETLDIEIHTPSGVCMFESLSGGEKFRVGFAIRLALSTLQARRMGGEMQMLLLDEVSSSLDMAGLDSFLGIIRKLEKDMKVLVITHDDKLKDEFDTVITVRKNAEGSRIER